MKVADFGIAAVLSDSMSKHSMEGKVSGTLSYMSPQQLEGQRPSVSDDIHALGATIYELLTGKPPFFRGNQAAIYQQIINVVPPSMAERRGDLEVVGKAPIPAAWEETIAACLAKDPAERPQSAGEVLARLRVASALRAEIPAFPQGQRPPPPPPTPSAHRADATLPPPPPPERRSRAPLVWSALAAVALAAGGVFYFGGGREESGTGVPPVVPATPTGGTPVPLSTPAPTPMATPVPTPRPATPAPTPQPTPAPTPMPATPPPATPVPAPPPITPATATKDAPFVNTLGMRFVPVPGTSALFCVWETRVRDFEEFIQRDGYDMKKGEKAYTLESGGWKQAGGDWRNPRFPQPQGEDHPVVCVSLTDAKAFCDWLTAHEQKLGAIPAGARYRVPSDEEWSAAVGESAYPWGDTYPPRQPVGNYAGTEANIGAFKSNNFAMIPNYNDGFPRTAPVGSFAANRHGIYDLGGNVWEWCDTPYKASMNSAEALKKYPILKEEKASDGTAFRVLRGASWFSDGSVSLGASLRDIDLPLSRYGFNGFRVVLVVSGR